MKPRLQSRQFTKQDVEAMCHVSRLLRLRHGPGAATLWLIATAEADRRDAGLMWSLESHKANGAPAHLIRAGQLCGFDPYLRAFVRVPELDAAGDITNFA